MTGYFDIDGFGVPGRMLNLTDEFYGALGRVAALGALVELKMSDLVVQWGGESGDTGEFMSYLTDRAREIMKMRRTVGQDVPDGLLPAVTAARAAMDERNELLHSLWPGEHIGWRNRRQGAVPTEYVGVPALRDVIKPTGGRHRWTHAVRLLADPTNTTSAGAANARGSDASGAEGT